ncbi:polysaccharide deacetylase familiy protein [Anaerocolumna cellulosilytica]|uniref:Polysaccharide deacetylase familiy protein n=1 Tax=Anaerocolumna cellulosilytica TaxID=433286 RepID=A0A6S6QZA2_9FIRM|nr:polysaccharide deacetylase family protein [Anaerocolumna cellulosilytica]MBB5197876.1 peptidoglycan/xylan/chitin deacetylase (PgdA/CDA1 family) [Anaerocolumna cellulosilytica]BCJ93187.1 polysaccharide deacetylase familiy protein [Anaerocolumna cellulosilytica]
MKKLVLTFDDGPNPLYTEKLLEVLNAHKVKATFFVVTKDAICNPKLIERMKQDGHEIALHSLEHRHALLSGYIYTKNDFTKSIKLLKMLNCKIRFYRPPWGVRNLYTANFTKKHNLHMVLWDVMVEDWRVKNTPGILASRINRKVFDGAIICLHDGGERHGGDYGAPLHMIKALQMVLPKLKKEGYEFVTVGEYFDNE